MPKLKAKAKAKHTAKFFSPRRDARHRALRKSDMKLWDFLISLEFEPLRTNLLQNTKSSRNCEGES